MLEVMFSEHCSYKSSRPILKLLPSTGRRVVLGPGFDSGVVDIGDGYVIAFKIESHNHPSAIDPYNGAATGVGGIIRDVLTMNCRPIALLDSLRFGRLELGRTRWLFTQVVRGIGDYGNCVGIPTVAGEVEFDESFDTNCLVNVACIGLGRAEDLLLPEMDTPGDFILIAGGSTGRDGIHGVTFASKTIGKESEEDRPSVQVGDPFTKKVLLEATLEAIATGHVRALKDLGGGGLTCAVSEMAYKGTTGAEVYVDSVWTREEGMDSYEVMLSESQERMLFVVRPEGLEVVKRVFDKWEVRHAVIGRVTNTGLLTVKRGGELVASLPTDLLANVPTIARKWRRPSYLRKLRDKRLPEPANLGEALLRLLRSPNIASKDWVYRQYDHEVGVRTVVKPGDGDAAVLRIMENGKAIAVKSDCNSRHSFLDPFNGHAGAIAEAARNVVAVGAEPLAIADGCNFGDPTKPEVFWQFREAIRGMRYMLRALEIPCVGGNVSFYNEDRITGVTAKPTSIVVMLGLIEDMRWVTTMALKSPGDQIVIIGETRAEMGGSEYYHEVHNIKWGRPPRVRAEQELASLRTCMQAIRMGLVTAAHDCGKGGLAAALALMAMKGGKGLEVNLKHVPVSGTLRSDELLFSESQGRFVVTSRAAREIIKLASANEAPAAVLGKVRDDERFILRYGRKQLIELPITEMRRHWEEAIPKAVEGTL